MSKWVKNKNKSAKRPGGPLQDDLRGAGEAVLRQGYQSEAPIWISKSTTDALMKLSIENNKPIGNGLITSLNMKQAKARRKKGKEAAHAVISILSQ